MEPFKVSSYLKEMVSPYPEAKLISEAAKHGGESARQAIARQWLSEGIPFAFKECPGIYESVRSWVGSRLNIDPKELNVTGSARLGQSLAPHKMGKPFGDGSDLDIFIISSELFEHLKSDFNEWSYDFERGFIMASNDRENGFWIENLHRGPKNIARGFIDSNIVPNHDKYRNVRNISQTMYLLKEKLDITNDRENGFWIENLHRGPKNIARGFIDSNIVPNHDKYRNVRNISQTMYLLKEKLDITTGAPKFCHASVRCYKSWPSYVQQISLGFQ